MRNEVGPAATRGSAQLCQGLGPFQLFCLAFGAILGAGWIIAVGEWIGQAGPIGTVIGFIAGSGALSMIALCYAELGALFPETGGEVVYAQRLFGREVAYYTGWFLAIIYIGVCAFSAISIGWVIEALLPGSAGPSLYTLLAQPIHAGGLIAGSLAIAAVTTLQYRGVQTATIVQGGLTVIMIGAFLVFLIAGLAGSGPNNLHPWFAGPGGAPPWRGALGVFITAPFWFSGFAAMAQALGETKNASASRRTLQRTFLGAINAACLFYCGVVLVTAAAVPRDQLLSMDLPAAGAFVRALHSTALARLVLVTGLLGLLVALNALLYSATRVLYVLARDNLLPARLASVDPGTGTPRVVVVFVGAVALLGTALGRGAIMPLVDATSVLLAGIYVIVCAGAWRARHMSPAGRTSAGAKIVPWLPGIALLIALGLLVLAVIEPWRAHQHGFPPEFAMLLGSVFVGFALRRVSPG